MKVRGNLGTCSNTENYDAYSGMLTTFYERKTRSKDKESRQGCCRIGCMAHLDKHAILKRKKKQFCLNITQTC